MWVPYDPKTNYVHMKKIQLFFTLLVCLFLYSCNDEWKDELFEKKVSFENSGLTNVYLRYTKDGVIPYKIPILVNGTTKNNQDIQVTVSLDPDTLADLNFDRFRLREDLYFKQLEPQFYEFKSMKGTISKGEDIGFINIDFKLDKLNLVEKYILPLEISETSVFAPNEHKHYKKSLMQIIPFNDYSGSYSATTMLIWDANTKKDDQTPQNVPNREARVVDEHSVFFYAGTIEQESIDREMYKIIVTFSQTDSTLILSASNPIINFSYVPENCYYKVNKEMDPLLPYLEKTYTTLYLDYKYDDITTPAYPLNYQVDGSMTLERRKNIQIPDEDQPEIF